MVSRHFQPAPSRIFHVDFESGVENHHTFEPGGKIWAKKSQKVFLFNPFKPRTLIVVRISTTATIMIIELLALILSHYGAETCPSCRFRKQLQNDGIETSVQPTPTLFFQTFVAILLFFVLTPYNHAAMPIL